MNFDKFNLQDLTNIGVESVEIDFLDCDSILIPINCFKDFIFMDNELYFKIINNGEIEYIQCYDKSESPIHRIRLGDIVRLYFIKDTDEFKMDIDFEFNDKNEFEDRNNNLLQQSNIINYKEIEVSISRKAYYINELKTSIKKIKRLENYIKDIKQELNELGVKDYE